MLDGVGVRPDSGTVRAAHSQIQAHEVGPAYLCADPGRIWPVDQTCTTYPAYGARRLGNFVSEHLALAIGL